MKEGTVIVIDTQVQDVGGYQYPEIHFGGDAGCHAGSIACTDEQARAAGGAMLYKRVRVTIELLPDEPEET